MAHAVASASGDPSAGELDAPVFAHGREFWLIVAHAVGLGVFGALAGLVFLGVVEFGRGWYDDVDPDWFGGGRWWVAVAAGAGLVVGVLHRLTPLPDNTPGLIADLQSEQIEAKDVTGSWRSLRCR